MTLPDFLRKVDHAFMTTPHYRYGQALFNELCEANPSMAERIGGTSLDSFYFKETDEGYVDKMAKVIDYISTNWETTPC